MNLSVFLNTIFSNEITLLTLPLISPGKSERQSKGISDCILLDHGKVKEEFTSGQRFVWVGLHMDVLVEKYQGITHFLFLIIAPCVLCFPCETYALLYVHCH